MRNLKFLYQLETILSEGQRAFYFICGSESERENWIKTLNSVISGECNASSKWALDGYTESSLSSSPKPAITFVATSPATRALNIMRQPWFRRSASDEDVKVRLCSLEAIFVDVFDSTFSSSAALALFLLNF